MLNAPLKTEAAPRSPSPDPKKSTAAAVAAAAAASASASAAAAAGTVKLEPTASTSASSTPAGCGTGCVGCETCDTRPILDTRALAEASRNLTQTLKQLSSEVLTSR